VTIIISRKPFGKRPFDPFEAKRFAELLDQELGDGFAARNPECVTAYTQRRARDSDETIADAAKSMAAFLTKRRAAR
jgi:hypothetical protein